jgi:hypothetical protein
MKDDREDILSLLKLNLGRVIRGKEQVIEHLLVALLAEEKAKGS